MPKKRKEIVCHNDEIPASLRTSEVVHNKIVYGEVALYPWLPDSQVCPLQRNRCPYGLIPPACFEALRTCRQGRQGSWCLRRCCPVAANSFHIRNEGKKRMARQTARSLGGVSFGSPLLKALSDYDRRIKVQGVIVKQQFREEPTEQFTKHTLVDAL